MANDTMVGRTYRRDDGALMVEVQPGQFVNEEVAANLVNKASPTSQEKPAPNRGRRQLRTPKEQ